MWPFLTPFVTILALKRTCPKCGKSQVAPRDKRNEPIVCSHCGAVIPPEETNPGDQR